MRAGSRVGLSVGSGWFRVGLRWACGWLGYSGRVDSGRVLGMTCPLCGVLGLASFWLGLTCLAC